MPERRPAVFSGVALILAGLLVVVVNAWLTPMLQGVPFAQAASSDTFLLRQALSGAAAAFLIVGVSGLHRAYDFGAFGGLAAVLALLGSAALFANEWSQVFLVRDIAILAPDALDSIDDGAGLSWWDIGSLSAFAAFSLGWLMLALFLLFTGYGSRLGAGLVLAGLLSTPALAGLGAWAPAIGSVVLGAGWALLGWGLMRPPSGA